MRAPAFGDVHSRGNLQAVEHIVGHLGADPLHFFKHAVDAKSDGVLIVAARIEQDIGDPRFNRVEQQVLNSRQAFAVILSASLAVARIELMHRLAVGRTKFDDRVLGGLGMLQSENPLQPAHDRPTFDLVSIFLGGGIVGGIAEPRQNDGHSPWAR